MSERAAESLEGLQRPKGRAQADASSQTSRDSAARARIVAVDLGGSGFKMALFDAEGEVVAAAAAPVAFDEDGRGTSEKDPEAWWLALGCALSELSDAAPEGLQGVAALAITGFTRTHVFVDEAGRSTRPALGLGDTRASEAAGVLRSTPGIAAHPETARLDAGHPLARLAWLKAAQPRAFARTRVVIEPKDYLSLRLCGAVASDPISSARLIAACEGGSKSLAAFAGLPALLPPLAPVGGVIGAVRRNLPEPFAALAGARVVMAAHDSWCAVLGLGAMNAGEAYCVAGTTEVTGLLCPDAAASPGLMGLPWGEKLWHLGGPTSNGASALDWLRRLLGELDEARLTAAFEQREVAAPLFLPYLRGERAPHWDPDLRGAVFGLSDRHGPEDVAVALMEGLALASADILERAERAAGLRAETLRLGGGGARNKVLRRLRADILQRPVLSFGGDESGLRGCLALACAALGYDASPEAAAERVAPPVERTEPDPARATRSAARLEAYRALLPAARDAGRALAAAGP